MNTPQSSLVTGGAGFIGSHLCDALLDRGDEVYCIDNLVTGSLRNLSYLKNNPRFHFIEYDIIKPFPKRILNKLSNINFLYHLASPASPPRYRELAIETLLVNSEGTFNMLEYARIHHGRFLLASTSEVYGDPLIHPQREDYFGNVNPIGLRACYDESKRFAEALSMEYHRKYDMDVRIVRIFNTFGPRMEKDDGRVISNFINQALENKPLTVYGDGSQTRSFCYVSDLVNGLLRVMDKNGIDGYVVNLGNTNEQSVNQIAEKIVKLAGSSSKIIRIGQRLGNDPQRRKPDITKVKRLTGWDPKVSLEEGLQKTIAYFKSL